METLNFTLFMILSVAEVVANVILMFTIFRIPKKHYLMHAVFMGIVMSYISHNVRNIEELTSFAIIIQVTLQFLFVWLMYRIQVFYSLIISILSYFIYGIVQLLLIFLLNAVGIIEMDQLSTNIYIGYCLQLLTVILVIIISEVLERKQIGFNFVPHSEFAPIELSKGNILFTVVIVLCVVAFQMLYYFSVKHNFLEGFIEWLIISIILAVVLIFLAIKKEKSDDL